MEKVFEFWLQTMNDQEIAIRERIKVSENIAKAHQQNDAIEKTVEKQSDVQIVVQYGKNT